MKVTKRALLIAALLSLIATGLWAATAVVNDNLFRLGLDDSGGGGGGYQDLVYPTAPLQVNHLQDGYFSVVEEEFEGVLDGYSAIPDWAVLSPLGVSSPGSVAPTETSAAFADWRYGMWQVDQRTYSYNAPPDNGYAIVVYTLTNVWAGTNPYTLDGTIRKVYPTVWFDFDANNTVSDSWGYDASRSMAYQYDPGQSYVGVVLLEGTPYSVHANTTPLYGYSPLPESDRDEMAAVLQPGASLPAGGNDFATSLTTGPFDVSHGDSVTFPIAVVTGSSLAEIQAAATAAKLKYGAIAAGGGGPTPAPMPIPSTMPSGGNGGGHHGGGGPVCGACGVTVPFGCYALAILQFAIFRRRSI